MELQIFQLVQSPRSHAETFPSTIFCVNICSSHLWTLSLAVHEDETLESLHRCSFCCQILGTFGSFVVEFTDLILPLITNTLLFIRHTNKWMNQRRERHALAKKERCWKIAEEQRWTERRLLRISAPNHAIKGTITSLQKKVLDLRTIKRGKALLRAILFWTVTSDKGDATKIQNCRLAQFHVLVHGPLLQGYRYLDIYVLWMSQIRPAGYMLRPKWKRA